MSSGYDWLNSLSLVGILPGWSLHLRILCLWGLLPEVFFVYKVSWLEGLYLMFPLALPDQQRKMKIYIYDEEEGSPDSIYSLPVASHRKMFNSSPVILPVNSQSVVMGE